LRILAQLGQQGHCLLVERHKGFAAQPVAFVCDDGISEITPTSSIAKPESAAGRFVTTLPVANRARIATAMSAGSSL
jgi:hypothetical protein